MRDEKIDLVHANGNSALLYASIAARVGGARLVWHLHDPQSRVGLRHRALLFVLRQLRPDELIFSSPAASKSWLKIWGEPHPNVCTILPDVDTDGIANGDGIRARRQLDLGDQAPIIVMLARPVAYKGHEELVRAAAVIHARIPAVRVVMSTGWQGDEDFRDRLRRLAEELGAGDAICLPPTIDATLKADLLAACSVLAHPAWAEPFGLAMLEAMTAGRPVVAADSDGSRFLVQPGLTGLLVPPRDPPQLATALLELLEDPARARQMGAAGRHRALALSDGRMVERIQDVWEAALCRPR
jgi:glycosyltransferase involved in cell wall biosynthesis